MIEIYMKSLYLYYTWNKHCLLAQYWVFPIRKLTKFRSSFPGVYCPLPSANTATYNYEVNHGRQNWLEEQILGTLYIRSMHPNFLHQIILNTQIIKPSGNHSKCSCISFFRTRVSEQSEQIKLEQIHTHIIFLNFY